MSRTARLHTYWCPFQEDDWPAPCRRPLAAHPGGICAARPEGHPAGYIDGHTFTSPSWARRQGGVSWLAIRQERASRRADRQTLHVLRRLANSVPPDDLPDDPPPPRHRRDAIWQL